MEDLQRVVTVHSQNDLYCVGLGVKLYSLTHSVLKEILTSPNISVHNDVRGLRVLNRSNVSSMKLS